MAIGLIALALVLVGCSSSDDAAPATTASTTTSTTASGPIEADPSAGCATPTGEPIDRVEVTVDGTERSALVHVPADAEPGEPLPLILSFHGVDGSPAVQQLTDGLAERADADGFVVAYPEGLVTGLNDQVQGITGWDAYGSEVDEVAYISAVLDEVGKAACIDRARTFFTGFSAGGNIALVAACALPDRVAAVAPVSAAFQPDECEGAPPIPIRAFQGDDDLIVPSDGRSTPEFGTLLPARDVLAAQAERNGCDPKLATTAPTDGVEEITWEGCEAPTSLVELADHGHAWPGRPMAFPREVLVGLFAGDGTRPPSPLMEAIGSTPEAMADNVLLTSTAIDATDDILDFFAEVRPPA